MAIIDANVQTFFILLSLSQKLELLVIKKKWLEKSLVSI